MAWIEFLNEPLKKYPQNVALRDQAKKTELTYEQLNQTLDRYVSFLEQNAIGKGDVVALLQKNCLEHVTLFLACARIGAIFLPLNFRLSCEELQELCLKAHPKILFSDEQLKGVDQIFSLNELIEHKSDSSTLIETDESDPLLMLFTSGTTGNPKGVLFHGKMLESNQDMTSQEWGLLPNDQTIIETPFFHTGGYNVLLLPLLKLGGTCIIAEKFDLDNFYQTLKDYPLSVYFGVPTMFQMIAEDPRFSQECFKHFRFLISGGAYCPVELIQSYQKINIPFKQGFGLTEVGPNCFLLKEECAVSKVGSIGVPMPHSEVRLVNGEGKDCKEQEIGEILIKGPHLCRGYFKEPERFSASLQNGLFRTGDLAKKDEDGFFYIVGRIKDMYISGGENVYPAEVEKQILKHSKIFSVCVVPVPHEKWGEVGLCYFTGAKDINKESLQDFLNQHLSPYKRPQYWERLGELPLLPNGKIDRKKLKESASSFLNNHHGAYGHQKGENDGTRAI